MTLHIHVSGSHHRQKERQQEIDLARNEFKKKVRNDWYYPTLPQYQSCGRQNAEVEVTSEKIAGFRIHGANRDGQTHGLVGEILGLEFDPVEWRERSYSSVSETEEDKPTPTVVKKGKREVYRYENPDSVGTLLSQRRQARKRKRQERLEAEMAWNEGLALWIRRRDLWSCAHPPSQVHQLDAQSSDLTSEAADGGASDSSSSTRTSTSSHPANATNSERHASPATTPTSTPDLPKSHSRIAATSGIPHVPPHGASSLPTTPSPGPSTSDPDASTSDLPASEAQRFAEAQPPTSSTVSVSGGTTTTTTFDDPSASSLVFPHPSHANTTATTITAPTQPTPRLLPNMLLPLAPDILPADPTRLKMAEKPDKAYAEIYYKIMQGRLPNVWINLSTLTRALVHGWVADGEWPPRSSVTPSAAVGKTGKGLAANAAKGIGGAGNLAGHRDHRGQELVGSGRHDGPGASLRQGVKAVGRALRLTGGDGK